MHITRHVLPFLEKSLDLFQGVLIVGARQVGKSTAIDQISALKETVTLDNLNVLEALHEDAYQYIKNLKRPAAIDEIQKTLTAKDLQSTKAFLAEHKQAAGVILYLGNEVINFGPNLRAVPISTLF